MIETNLEPPLGTATPVSPPPSDFFQPIVFWGQFLLAMGVGIAVLAYLLFWPEVSHNQDHSADLSAPAIKALSAVSHQLIEVNPDSKLNEKLAQQIVEVRETRTPLLRVTGSVVASLRPIGDDNSDQWQFNDPELLSTFFDWGIASLDIDFFEQQLELLEELSQTQIDAQRRVVERMERLVGAGTDTVAELELARAELLEREISARQALREAQNELLRARRNESTLQRRLELDGLDPVVLKEEVTSDVDLVMADVPEEFKERVRIGQSCEARFIGMRDVPFRGVVRSIGGVLSPERRSLRVLFFVDDPDDKLRPGMFAEIGLGVDPRPAIRIPATSVIHIGMHDYVFVQSSSHAHHWQVTMVELGDKVGGEIEVFAGLQGGERIISRGAMLLQPAAVIAMRLSPTGTPDPESSEVAR
jgi:cobalt-zinc-cadmium efflux system membrane fusion protein